MAEIAQLKREKYDFESLQTQLTAALERCNRLEMDLRQARQQAQTQVQTGPSTAAAVNVDIPKAVQQSNQSYPAGNDGNTTTTTSSTKTSSSSSSSSKLQDQIVHMEAVPLLTTVTMKLDESLVRLPLTI